MKESFVFYQSFAEAMEELTDEQCGKVSRIIYNYALYGNEPENISGIEKIVFSLIKPQIDANNKRYLDGKKGGRPKTKKTSGFENKKPVVLKNEENKKPNVNVNVNVNENVNDNENVNVNEENKKQNNFSILKNSSLRNPDLMFDKNIDEVFSLYEKLCPNLASLVFERRNLERRQEVKEFLWLVQSNMDYIKGLFMRANEQKTFYDNPINFKALIKNHESIYQGLGKAKAPPKETGETMKENFAKWRKEAEEREALNGSG